MNKSELVSKYKGAALGAALGDALGSFTENKQQQQAERIYGKGLRSHNHPLEYTDDTEMSIALLESLVNTEEFSSLDFANRLVQERKNNRKYRGYSPKLDGLLSRCKDGNELIEEIQKAPRGSPNCGAAIRAFPIGLHYAHDLTLVAQKTQEQAEVTHIDPFAIKAAKCAAQAVALAMTNQPHFNMRIQLSKAAEAYDANLADDILSLGDGVTHTPHELVEELRYGDNIGIPVDGKPVVYAALWAFFRNPTDIEKVLHSAITLGGDTDSVATIAGAIAGAYNGVEKLPKDLLARLEGKERIESLAELLAHKKH